MRQGQSNSEQSGESRILSSVLTSWASHAVFIVAGFLLPRWISDSLGPELLGVWDFTWSLIAYFGIVQGGVGASVNRFVAMLAESGNRDDMSKFLSSAAAIQCGASLIVISLSVIFAFNVAIFLGREDEALRTAAFWSVLWVGAGLAVQMVFNSFVGLITGLHRWDIHNALNATGYVVSVALMGLTLSMDLGLPALAFANFLGTTTTEIVRARIGYFLYPKLRMRPGLVNVADMRKQIGFGAKAVLPSISGLIRVQSVNLLIAAILGPAALAIFARPMALIRHVQTLVAKFAVVLTPISSAASQSRSESHLQDLFLKVNRSSYLISIPLVGILIIYGSWIIELWMGPSYVVGGLVTILAIGHFATIVQAPTHSFLMGLNLHGFPGVTKIVAALSTFVCVYLVLAVFRGTLNSTAIASVIFLLIADGLILPAYALRKLDISVIRYLREAVIEPFLINAPFFITLLIGNEFISRSPFALAGLLIVAGTVNSAMYWNFGLSKGIKDRLLSRVRFSRS